jgi:protein-tyrosine phosphatase
MVLDSPASPVVIIMLTQTVEANREKCFQYYPLDMTSPTLPVTDPEDESFAVTVTLQSIHVDTTTQSTIRELLVQSADGTRKKKVWHLLYASWPDFLVPEGEDRLALLRLIKLSRKLAASELGGSGSGKGKTGTAATATTTVAAPTVKLPERLVHCSAGVGRTGTFIALDWLIDELNAGALDESALGAAGVDEGGEADKPGEDPIVDLVDRLRQQRMMMVQGEMQFGFLYEVLADLWLEIWKAKHGTE